VEQAFNLPAYIPVEEQIAPHPDFPTVAFPNPEEGKGALKLAIQRADSAGSPLILANDPDADRLAVAEKLDEYAFPFSFPSFLASVLWTEWLTFMRVVVEAGRCSPATKSVYCSRTGCGRSSPRLIPRCRSTSV
jgi:phosphomannomutase